MHSSNPARSVDTVRALALACLLAFSSGNLHADGAGPWGGSDKLDPAQERLDAEDYDGAIGELDKLLAEEPNDADVLNLLGYSHRQMARYDVALDYYQRALAEDPEHRGALEYLGELYLQTDQVQMAEEQLARLKDLCLFCRERRDLTKAIERYRDANS